MKVYLTAIIKFKPRSAALLKTLLKELVSHSLKEQACEQYELYQDSTDENTFIFHETWQDQEALNYHEQQPHFLSFKNAVQGLTAGDLIIYKTAKIA